MAQMPVEIVEVGDVPSALLDRAISNANSLQSEFRFDKAPARLAAEMGPLAANELNGHEFLEAMDVLRIRSRGFHPHVIAVVDAHLSGERYSNLFADDSAEIGLGVLTTHEVPGVIIPPDRLEAYFLYYLAKFALIFVVNEHPNHDDTRGCVYDSKLSKLDLIESMRARALCEECRKALNLGDHALSAGQLNALLRLFDESGRVLDNSGHARSDEQSRVFIGSSSEGLEVARRVQAQLREDLRVDVWNQGTVFGLGTASLEALEVAAAEYDFGVFVFTPDDELTVRGETSSVARDNVLFELGLFVGALTRRRAFVLEPTGGGVKLPSDLAGIATAQFDPGIANVAAAVSPACLQIRDAIRAAES